MQGMNGEFDKSNKCDPTLNQATFIFQTNGRRCGEVPQEARRERQRIDREGSETGVPHKAQHYFSVPPPPVGELAECASQVAQLSQGHSV